MNSLEINIVAGSDWGPDTLLQVYWDRGDGSSDLTRSLLGKAVRVWEELTPFIGWLESGWLGSSFLGALPKTGWLEIAPWMDDPWLEPQSRAIVRTPLPRMDFNAQIAVRPVDLAGNALAGTPTDYGAVVRQKPPGSFGFTLAEYESGPDRARFTFTPHQE